MNNQLNLPAQYLELLHTLFRQYLPDTPIWAYGSRVKGTNHPASDLDLVAHNPIPSEQAIADLKTAIHDSTLPILVDLHHWDSLPPAFQQEIIRNYTPLR